MSRGMTVGLVFLSLLAAASAGAVDRVVVMEHFTNANCSYCATYEQNIKNFVANHGERIIVVQYHTDWPWYYDPFQWDNRVENNARVGFYGVTGVPHIILDGRTEPVYGYTPARLEAGWDEVADVPCQIIINLSGHYDPTRDGTGTVIAEIILTEEITGAATDLRVMMAICENGIHYSAPNGVSLHHWVMRDIFPSTGGVPITFSGVYPETLTVIEEFAVDSSWRYHANSDSCYIACFVQNQGSRPKIKQGAMIRLDKFRPTSVASDEGFAAVSRALGQNFPNPCNPMTTIPVSLDHEAAVALGIYDVEGRLVRKLAESVFPAGIRPIQWDGRDDLGRRVSSGIYYCRFESEGVSEARKMVVIR